jgi:hypothetical protein
MVQGLCRQSGTGLQVKTKLKAEIIAESASELLFRRICTAFSH